MDTIEFLRALSEGGTHGWEYIHSNFDPARAVPILFAALTAVTSVYLKWRNSGYRLVTRLEEFLKEEESKLATARAELARLIEYPSPDRPLDRPAFGSRPLSRALRKMDWGYGIAASNDLKGSVNLSSDQARLSANQSEQHLKRKALAHLLLGARAASHHYIDPIQRNEARSRALAEFDNALKINSKDAQALEYAGMMLLELANPRGALERFKELIEVRKVLGGADLARAYRLQASAFENLPSPELGNANIALNSAFQHMPADATLDRAQTHEHQGLIRSKLENFRAANRNFEDALTIYQALRNTAEGQAGLVRVKGALARLNKVELPGLLAQQSKPAFFARFTKLSG